MAEPKSELKLPEVKMPDSAQMAQLFSHIAEKSQAIVNGRQGLFVICVKWNDFPQFCRHLRSFHRLHAQVQLPSFLPDSGVIAVGKWTGGLAAKASQIVLVPTECLCLGSDELTSPCTSSGSG